MENTSSTIEKLFERIEQDDKNSFEHYQYSTIYETVVLFSFTAVKFILFLVVLLISLLYTIALSTWMGDILRNTAYGFLLMGMFYILLGVFLSILRKPWLKTPVNNFGHKNFDLSKH